MPKYAVTTTVNFPESETDLPTLDWDNTTEMVEWIGKLMDTENATSFVITICKKD